MTEGVLPPGTTPCPVSHKTALVQVSPSGPGALVIEETWVGFGMTGGLVHPAL